MADSGSRGDQTAEWTTFAERVNESVANAIRQNIAAQSRFVEAWSEAVTGAEAEATEWMTDGAEGYARAYETWMGAMEEQYERVADAMRGDEVSPEDFRNIWLSAANQAFHDVMNTSAFAAATGESVDDALAMQRRFDEAAEDSLHSLGFATGGDVEEVGSRLVELERRQQAVEANLQRILDAVHESE